ncbi:hypothetical protein LIER_38388 [Lithospermum erythrorhizon]|uniref:Reverse transcriptase n=1 Tax=Lithospermum erythrorhizon TaxID=34254 RepID=A0AAV3PZZ1_LITER
MVKKSITMEEADMLSRSISVVEIEEAMSNINWKKLQDLMALLLNSTKMLGPLKGGKARCALKIDNRKAHDTVDWDFLWKVMATLKYPIIFINLIRACVSTTWFSISRNGILQGHFKSSRGWRQVTHFDPISVLLLRNVSLSC